MRAEVAAGPITLRLKKYKLLTNKPPHQMKKDIEHRADIELLVNAFCSEVRQSNILGYIFDDVAKVDWKTHLPKMHLFWSNLLLGEKKFSGNPIQTHIELNQRTSLTSKEFEEWLCLFCEAVDKLFEGKKAEEAKQRAANIARLMLYKIETA